MIPARTKRAAGIAFGVSAVIVLLFVAAAQYSRAQHSLLVVDRMGWAKVCLLLLVVVAVPLGLLVALVSRPSRIFVAMLLPSLVLALFAAESIHNEFGYSEEAALQRLIDDLDPLVIAVRSFEREQGRLPERLEELVPRYVPAIPTEVLLVRPLEIQFEHEHAWRIWAEEYVCGGFDGTLGKVEYRPDQHYEVYSPEYVQHANARWGEWRGWRWLIWE